MTDTQPVFDPANITVYDELNAQLDEFAKLNKELTFDYADPQGNIDARSHVHKLRRTKGVIEKTRKATKEDALAFGREVDAQANKLKQRVDDMIEVHDAPLREIKEREEARIREHQGNLNNLRMCADLGANPELEMIEKRLDWLAKFDLDSMEEFTEEATNLHATAKTACEYARDVVKKHLAEKEELERLRREAAEREEAERVEREKREAKEAAERAQAEREKREAIEAKEAAERAQREAQEALEIQKRLAEKAAELAEAKAAEKEAKAQAEIEAQKRKAAEEKERAERIQRETEQRIQREAAEEAERKRIEDEKRAADQARRKEVVNEILTAFEDADATAKLNPEYVTCLIVEGSIPHVKVTY